MEHEISLLSSLVLFYHSPIPLSDTSKNNLLLNILKISIVSKNICFPMKVLHYNEMRRKKTLKFNCALSRSITKNSVDDVKYTQKLSNNKSQCFFNNFTGIARKILCSKSRNVMKMSKLEWISAERWLNECSDRSIGIWFNSSTVEYFNAYVSISNASLNMNCVL